MGATDKHMVCRTKTYVLQFGTHAVGPSMYLNSSMNTSKEISGVPYKIYVNNENAF